MKKTIRTIAAVAAFILASGCAGDRSSVFKIYNWSDYIGEGVLEDFADWYEEQTGERVEIVYQTFDINETMLSKIEKGHEDYDVVCPSDYIIERMLRSDLLIPIDKDFGDTPNYIDEFVSPYIRECFDLIDGSGKNANDYSVGYMWGTTGILYNRNRVDAEAASSWDVLLDERYAGKLFVKDAPRDVFSALLIHLRQEQLHSGRTTLEELMYDSADSTIAAVEEYMSRVKPNVGGWEADFGKEQMTQEKGWLNLTWSGDAVWAIEEASEVGVDLEFLVPKEGSNVWFDGWVIPKYAKNVKAARYFINYMCRPDIAIRNMDEIGYVSAVGGDEVLESIQDDETYDPVDLTYFFGPQADSVCANPSMYFDKSVIDRCTMMHDWGDETPKLISMWARVKGDNATPFTYIVIAVTLGGIAFLEIFKRVSRARRKRNRRV